MMRRNGIVLWVALTVAAMPLACTSSSLTRFKIVYLDMDGTLLNKRHEIPEQTSKALERYRRCGGKVGIASGRTAEQVSVYLPKIRPNMPLVLFYGAVTTDPSGERNLFVQTLGLEPSLPIVREALKDPDVRLVVVHYADKTFTDSRLKDVQDIMGKSQIQVNETPADLPGRMETFGNAPVKVMLIVKRGTADAVCRRLAPHVPTTVKALPTSGLTVEIFSAKANKLNAIDAILKTHALSRRDLLVVGDSGNDVEMVGGIPAGIAMGNCHPKTCKEALLIAHDNDSDAIPRIIESLAIGPDCPIDNEKQDAP